MVLLAEFSWAGPGGPAIPDDILQRSKLIVARLLCILLLLSPGIVFVLIVLSGILFIMGAENPDQRGLAKKLLKNALIGAVIVVALVSIVRIPAIDIYVDFEMCLGTGPGNGNGSHGERGYLWWPSDGASLEGLTLLIPVLHRRWPEKRLC